MELASMQLELAILGKIIVAIVLCGAIGYERELENKPAGLRTHMIVGGTAALLVSLGDIYISLFSDRLFYPTINIDPLRIIEAIIVGISFIGAGTILKTQVSSKDEAPEQMIKNLTTAATILFSGGIGICVALEKYVLAIGVTVIVLIINSVVRRIEK